MATPDNNGEFQQAWLELSGAERQKIDARFVARDWEMQIEEVLGMNGSDRELGLRARLIHQELTNFDNDDLRHLLIRKLVVVEGQLVPKHILPIRFAPLNLREILGRDYAYEFGFGFAINGGATSEAFKAARDIIYERANDWFLVYGLLPMPGVKIPEEASEEIPLDSDSELGEFVGDLDVDI